MKFKLPFRSSHGSFTVNSSQTASDQVGVNRNDHRPSYRSFTPRVLPSTSSDHPPTPKTPPPTPLSSSTLPPLSRTPPPPLPSNSPPPLPVSPPPYEAEETFISSRKSATSNLNEETKQTEMGCVTSKPDVETGEKESSCHYDLPANSISQLEKRVDLKGLKNTDDEDRSETNGAESKDKIEKNPHVFAEHHLASIKDTPEINSDDLALEISMILEESEKENRFEKVDYAEKIGQVIEEQTTEISVETDENTVASNENEERNGDMSKTSQEAGNLFIDNEEPIYEKVDHVSEKQNDKNEEMSQEQPEEIEVNVKKIEVSGESGNIPNKKKEGVSAESSGTKVESAKEIQIASFEKDAASRELIRRALGENQFLNFGLDSEDLVLSVVDAMYIKNVPSGCYVIREGEAGSELYVCAKGTFDVFKGTEKVNTLGPGTVFGELAVLYHSKRNATIVATSDCSLWVLDRKVFHKIMMKAGMERQEENIRFLRSVPLLRSLDKASLSKMSDLLKMEYFNPGVDIVRQGDEGSKFYIITMGKVKVTVKRPEGVTELTLGKGDFFGERALLNDDVRKATVTALGTGTECLVLDRIPFIELLGSLKELQLAAGIQEARASETSLVSECDNVKLSDLSVTGTLGVGGFGRVELVRNKTDSRLFALKCIKKIVILEQQQQEHIFNEKEIMLSCRSPFIARLFKTYHDKKYLYLLMEACMGGDVWTLLQRYRLFDEPTARFMTGCVIEGLEYLHTRGIVYRDLKPENMMLDATGYIKLVDFGFAKKIGMGNKTWTFAGTPEYLAPEIVRNKGHDRAADYWSLGVFVHELLAGKPPFRGHDHHKTYNLILKGIDYVNFPAFIQKPAGMLIRKLCRPLPTDRLGYQKDGILSIKNHRWFHGFDWEALKTMRMNAPIVPRLHGPEDLSNFEKYPRDRDVPPDETSGWDVDF